MKLTSFASLEYAGKKRQTRGEMDQVMPWSRLEALIEPHNPNCSKVGRPPIGVLRM